MERKLTPLKAIRLKCIDCCCGSKTEVKLCVFDGFPLYAYRLGHIPKDVPTYDDGMSLETYEKLKENSADRLHPIKCPTEGGN